MISQAIRINAGENVIITRINGTPTTITGPALVIVVEEVSEAETSKLEDYDFVEGVAVKRTE